MELNVLTALSPADGRYRMITRPLSGYYSEYALIKHRVEVEVEYFIALCKLPLPALAGVDPNALASLRTLCEDFSEADASSVKAIEKTTNHDVKAVEYFIREKMDALGLGDHKEFIHFGLTSQDINNTAIPLALKRSMQEVILPAIEAVRDLILQMAGRWKDIPMLSRTHGQPASPTRLGKEMHVFHQRIREQLRLLDSIPYAAKFGGATGNFNAHHAAYPSIDWMSFANTFVHDRLGLHRSHPTTQIEHYDHLAALFDALRRINTILIDFSRDIWQYISMNYFRQTIKTGEIGSSTMPHKINPIDFENAEGNLGLANAIFEHLSSKLPVSRLQRDLTDSTVLRNIGMPMSYTLIALKALEKGIGKLELNPEALRNDLEANWVVIGEAIQTILRREGYPEPYEALRDLTRTHKKITASTIRDFIDALDVPEEIKMELKKITPFNYTGA